MASLNFEETTVAGNLAADAEVRSIPNTDRYSVRLRLGVTSRWKSKGEDRSHTEWYKVTRFCKEPVATWAQDQLKKGANVFVKGVKRTRNFKDRETENKVYYDEVEASLIRLIGNPNSQDATYSGPDQQSADDYPDYPDYDDQDRPFG